MLSSVDNIEAGNREYIGGGVSGNIGIMLPEGDTPCNGTGLTGGKRDCCAKWWMAKDCEILLIRKILCPTMIMYTSCESIQQRQMIFA